MIIQETALRRLTVAIVKGTGSTAEEAEIVGNHLVGANLAGHDSHGVGMLPAYVRNWHSGRLRPNTAVKTVKDSGPVLIFDGGLGYGQRVAGEAMDVAIERSRELGVALFALRNAHHVGRIGTYGEQGAAAGVVSVHFVNVRDHDPWVVPFGGSAARYITNPLCIAMPATDHTEQTVLDMATSRIAVGKVRVARNKGVPLDDGMLMHNNGRPTNDPNTLFSDPKQSSLMPFGEHKGSGLALFCELLAGALGGGGTIQPGNPRDNGIVNNMLSIVIDPRHLVEQEWMQNEIDALVNYVKSSPPTDPAQPTMVAGDPERKARIERRRDGIPMDDTTFEELMIAGETAKLARGELRQLAGVS